MTVISTLDFYNSAFVTDGLYEIFAEQGLIGDHERLYKLLVSEGYISDDILGPSVRVYDIGIGLGHSVRTFFEKAATVYGVDGAIETLRRCKIPCHKEAVDISNEIIPENDNDWTITISHQTMYFIKDLNHIIHEASRIMQDVGFFAFNISPTDSKTIETNYHDIAMADSKFQPGVMIETYQHPPDYILELCREAGLSLRYQSAPYIASRRFDKTAVCAQDFIFQK